MGDASNVALRRGDARQSVARFGFAPRVAGVPALPPDATESAWLAARRTLVTASEMAAVLGLSPHDSPFSLWWRKQPDWPDMEQTVNMHIGRMLEDVIGQLFSEAHPEAGLWRPGAALWTHPVETWMGATPDYLSVWPDVNHDGGVAAVFVEPVECKSEEGGEGWGKAGTDAVPVHHLCQVVTQCLVLGTRYGRVMRLAGKRPSEYRIDTLDHQDLVARIITEGRAFHTSLVTGVAPDIDAHTATTEVLQHLHTNVEKGTEAVIPGDLAREWREAKKAEKDAKDLVAFAANRIRDIIGRDNAQYAVTPDGDRVANRIIYKRQGYTVAPGIVDQLRQVKP